MTHLTTAGKRGCGSRKQNGLYMCTGLSSEGKPIEEFVLDPARPFQGNDPFRAPLLVEREDKPADVIVWIGESYYPYVPDYIEEVRHMGLSRRIPRNYPIEKLSPGSRMILIHAKAIPRFEYEVIWAYCNMTPWLLKACHCPGVEHECTFNLWALALLDSCKGHKVTDKTIQTPSVTYPVPVDAIDVDSHDARQYAKGAFAAFPITHLEYVNKEQRIPAALYERILAARLALEVVPE